MSASISTLISLRYEGFDWRFLRMGKSCSNIEINLPSFMFTARLRQESTDRCIVNWFSALQLLINNVIESALLLLPPIFFHFDKPPHSDGTKGWNNRAMCWLFLGNIVKMARACTNDTPEVQTRESPMPPRDWWMNAPINIFAWRLDSKQYTKPRMSPWICLNQNVQKRPRRRVWSNLSCGRTTRKRVH